MVLGHHRGGVQHCAGVTSPQCMTRLAAAVVAEGAVVESQNGGLSAVRVVISTRLASCVRCCARYWRPGNRQCGWFGSPQHTMQGGAHHPWAGASRA